MSVCHVSQKSAGVGVYTLVSAGFFQLTHRNIQLLDSSWLTAVVLSVVVSVWCVRGSW